MDFTQAVEQAHRLGHFWSPENPDGWNVTPGDLPKLSQKDEASKGAFRSLSRMMVRDYAVAVAKHHNRSPHFDGELGPAMVETLAVERCQVPDYPPPPGAVFAFDDPQLQQVCEVMQAQAAEPAVGKRGNWPRCHNVGEFHCCVVQVDMTNRPTWATDAVMKAVWKNVQTAYAAIGQWIVYVGKDGKDLLTGQDRSGEHVDTRASWVKSSSGWIGLAILTLDLGCSDEIWQQYLGTYQGGSTDASRITQNSSLWRHEHGHNSGLPHTNGGTMNPSIMNGLPVLWTPSDPSMAVLKTNYGGVPYAPDGPEPPQPPNPPSSIEQQLFEIRIVNAVQDVRDQLIDRRLRALEAK